MRIALFQHHSPMRRFRVSKRATVRCALYMLVAAVGAGAAAMRRPPGARERSLALRALPLREACRAAGVRYPPKKLRLIVRKGARMLAVYSGDRLVKDYPVGLGRCPVGDKSRQGDGKTPEGTFYVCTRLPQSRFYRFAGLSYPGPDDAGKGLRAGRIGAAEAREIENAQQKRRLPPWNTALGGAVGIHGGGAGADWTLGCIAMENADLDELFPLLALGTPVTIEP